MTQAYLRRILPAEQDGRYFCAAKLIGQGLANFFFPTIDALDVFVRQMDDRGETMYIGQAVYDKARIDEARAFNKSLPLDAPKSSRKKRRGQENALALKSFFFDIDCGPEKFAKDPNKSYPTQQDGAIALREFLIATKLPTPVLESSGRGLYARWVLTEELDSARWKLVAQKLKALCAHHGFKVDESRTSDSASVLRPLGAHNRKDPANPKEVKLVRDAEDVCFVDLAERVTAALASAKLPTKGLTPPPTFAGLNDAFASGIGDDHPPSDPAKVASKCPAVKKFRDLKGDVAEPVWYDMIGVLRHCVGGEEALQEWSSGHPDYSPAATEDKIQHHIDSGVGPTTCQKIGSTDASLCVACPYSGKIKSPITLGYPEAAPAEELKAEDEQVVPFGYRRTENGLYKGEDRFHPYDLYVSQCSMDHTLGHEVMTIRHQMPVSKEYKEFKVRTALMMKPTEFLMAMADNHCYVEVGDPRKDMMGYLGNYLQELKARRRVADLHAQMGWTKVNEGEEELVFILGSDIFRRGEEPIQAGLARSAPAVAGAFKAVGSAGAWSAATQHLSRPGLEGLAFSFLAGAFGAPLMTFTGHSGAMVSMVGRSGLGKTMTGKWALSAYGDPDALMLQKDDTPASMIGRLGTYGSLPAYIDEVSNMESGPLSELVYRITQGRERNRLTQRGEEKNGRNSWRTLALVSTNHPLTDRLAALKTDASAELNRLLEIHITTPPDFTAAHCREIFGVFGTNYGCAGREYVQYLVDNQDVHREKIAKLIVELETRAHALPEERFWIAATAVAIYGGLIAKKLGLIEFEVAPLVSWALRLITNQRAAKTDLVTSDVEVLGRFLDDHAAGGLITGRDAVSNVSAIFREPRGALVYRIMHDEHRLFVSRAALRTFLAKGYGNYTGLKDELDKMGALLDSDRRVVLGKGTYFAGAATTCWEIDLSVPALGRQILKIVGDAPVGLRAVRS